MRTTLLFSSLFLLAGCASQSASGGGTGDIDKMAGAGGDMAKNMMDKAWGPIAIHAKSGSNVKGTVTLVPVADGVKVVVAIQGAEAGDHGIHIHEKADCSSDDGKSAGGHWNPKGTDHALPPEEVRHTGDLGNIKVTDDGVGALEFTVKGVTLDDGEMSLANHGLIIHAKPDDGGQPTGNAGGRIGCAEFKKEMSGAGTDAASQPAE